ncbi:MAG: hypothetical protein OQL06_08250 [Gammaproteobacteria bacterium]|nr:hypothetical protein [Gammaproteobacteria bacterium]
MNSALVKIEAKTASVIGQLVELDDDARKLIDEGQTPAEYIQLLQDKKLYADAIRFLAMALPKREAVWWACMAVRSMMDKEAPPQELATLSAAEAWVYQPTEENRRQAMAYAEAADFKTAASWAATAAFWSAGSMAPPDAPVVPPGPDLTAKAVTGAVLLVVAKADPDKLDEVYVQMLGIGLDIAQGGKGV